MKKIVVCLGLMVVSLAVIAHEFWLQPQKYFFNKGETANIKFNLGEDFTGENWTGNNSKINYLIHCTPSNKQVDITSLVSDKKGDSIQLKLEEQGTHMIIYNSKNSFINLEPAKFNAYLKEDGMTNILNYRKKNNELAISGKEYYQRSVKTILQVGDSITPNCLQHTALPLDIVPEINPYQAYEITRVYKFKVLFKGSILKNQLVKVWFNTHGKRTVHDYYTDGIGIIHFSGNTSEYMVSTVFMEKNTSDSIAQWQSYWASVTFGFPAHK
ncbi:MAG: DUF4198 domain-containing protein [Deinococcales bacterium]|nr:DUF4198 domain-containing protein [Chitinophagaceae bacterium]